MVEDYKILTEWKNYNQKAYVIQRSIKNNYCFLFIYMLLFF